MSELHRVLILTADAGFGHRAAANAISAALAAEYGPRCSTLIANPLEDPRTPALLRNSQNNYDRIIERAPQLYRLGYEASDAALPVSVAEEALILMLYAGISNVLQSFQPDVVITTYPLYQAPLAAVFALGQHYLPSLTVVTDLASVHAVWFNDEVDYCLVPTEQVRQRALLHNLPTERIIVSGLPVDPTLGCSHDREALRRELGWDPQATVLLAVGSKRVQRLGPIIDVLNHSGLPITLACVAGGNEALLEEWQATEWHRPAHVYGMVPGLAKYLLSADLVACKAGGLMVSESLAAGKPLLLVEALPGQEIGNAEYVVEGGAGALIQSPVEALFTLCHWLERDGAELSRLAKAACALGRPEAARVVALLAWQVAEKGSSRPEHRLLAEIPFLRELLADVLRPRQRRAHMASATRLTRSMRRKAE